MIEDLIKIETEMVHNHNNASVAELVDAADSKSAGRKAVGVRVSPEAPTLYQLILLDDSGFPKPQVKNYIITYLNKSYPEKTGLGERVKNDEIIESDLFFLSSYLKKDPMMRSTIYKFKRTI
jgi:hypothetical protein